METETIMELPEGLKKRLEWAAVVGLEDIQFVEKGEKQVNAAQHC